MILAMVLTVSTGYLPTLVSPESITASAPSSTALATSEASARVGPRVLDHRVEHLGGDDDRLGVLPAQLHGALLHQRHLVQRQLDAEVAAGDHDAVEGERRSPRGASTASGFSTFAMTGRRTPSSSMISWTSLMSSGERTNDSAIRSTPRPQREAQVLGVLVGHGRAR